MTAVGMTAQQQTESGVRGVAINLRGVGQQNRKGIGRNVGGCFFDIIDPIVVSVVDTGQIDALATPRERFALVEQYANSMRRIPSLEGVLPGAASRSYRRGIRRVRRNQPVRGPCDCRYSQRR